MGLLTDLLGDGNATSASGLPLVKKRRTSGNLTLNSTSWANVDTALDIALNGVQVGDEIAYGISGCWSTEGVFGFLDVVTVVSTVVTNSFARRAAVEASPATTEGIPAWLGPSSERQPVAGQAPPYTVVTGDLADGTVTLRLRYATLTAADKTLFASTLSPLDVWAWNMGPAA